MKSVGIPTTKAQGEVYYCANRAIVTKGTNSADLVQFPGIPIVYKVYCAGGKSLVYRLGFQLMVLMYVSMAF